jgi:hypothetical protein
MRIERDLIGHLLICAVLLVMWLHLQVLVSVEITNKTVNTFCV